MVTVLLSAFSSIIALGAGGGIVILNNRGYV